MTSPQESRSILVDPATLPNRLFLCNEDRESLAGTAALDYIRHGEAQGFHKGVSVAGRRLWYALGQRTPTTLAMNSLVNSTAIAALCKPAIHFTHNFNVFHFDNEQASATCYAMNSSLTQLIINTEGVVNYGGGVLRIAMYDNANTRILDPRLVPDFDESIFRSTQWDVLSPSPERKAIDSVVFDALGLTEGERAGVHEAVSDLVRTRIDKAKSLRKGGGVAGARGGGGRFPLSRE